MIEDKANKQLLMEARDVNYILPSYIMSYLYLSKNEDPKCIVFPMFPSVPHPRKPGVQIPIKWVPMDEPIVAQIAEDGSIVPEVTPAQEAVLDKKDDEAKEMKEEMANLQSAGRGGDAGLGLAEPEDAKPKEDLIVDVETPITTVSAEPASQSKAQAAAERLAPSDRVPKMPASGDLGPGTSPDNMGSRDARLDKQISRDLKDEPEVDEGAEKSYDVEKSKEQ